VMPLGREVDLHMFADSDHASRFLHLPDRGSVLTMALCSDPKGIWLSQKHARIKHSVFGAAFVAIMRGKD
jgi:hypothetical protein